MSNRERAVLHELAAVDPAMAARTIYDVVGRISLNWGIGNVSEGRWQSCQDMWSEVRPFVIDQEGRIHESIRDVLDKAALPPHAISIAMVAVRLGAFRWVLSRSESNR